MANRILIGDHDNHGYGIFISRPGVDVESNIKREDLIFDSRSPEGSLVHEVIDATISNGNKSGSSVNFATSLSYVPHIDLVWLGSSSGNSARVIPTTFESFFNFQTFTTTVRYYTNFKCKVTSSSVQVSTAHDSQAAVSGTQYFKVVVYKMESLT